MKKIYFEEPEMEVVRFNARDLIITNSCTSGVSDDADYEQEITYDDTGDDCDDVVLDD